LNEHVLLATVIVLSLIFTYTNGFQDGSSVTATAIASRSLSPGKTVFVVALVELCGAVLGGSAVANSIASITNWPAQANLLPVLASGLAAAIIWNYLCKLWRFPSSSTHALVGGVVGAVITASRGTQHIVLGHIDHLLHATGLSKVLISLFVSPLAGFFAGYTILLFALLLLLRASSKINETVKSLQWITVSILAFGHGANDTQKAMGIIVLALNAAGVTSSHDIPMWVRFATGSAMALGIASLAQGIVRRIGTGIYKIQPVHALVSQIASALVVTTGSVTGGPISASQVIASSVVGVGAAQRKKGVHWLVARDMLIAWLLTIPGAALLACLIHELGFFAAK
jgi:PiT family inorganic phosphate transporter